MRNGSSAHWLTAVGLSVLVAAVYLPALRNGFVNWDDDIFVLDNPVLRAPDGLRTIWSTVELPREFPNYPLTFSSFWVEQQLWGANARAYHADNIVLHAINTGLVYGLVLALGLSPWVALVTAALFGVHPMQVESVAWVSERKNLLSAAFALLCALAYVRHRETRGRVAYALCLLAFAAALLSKTTLVVLPLSLLVLDRCRDGGWTRASFARLAPLFGLSAVAGLLTLKIENAPATIDWMTRPLLAARCLWFYAIKLALPWRLTPVYPRWDTSLTFWWWLPLIALCAPLAVALRTRDWRLRWGIAHFVILLLPVLGLRAYGFNEYSFVADRNVYLAAIGMFLVAAVSLQRWRDQRGPFVDLIAALVVGCLVAVTEMQIPVWRDSLTLWTRVLHDNPDANVAHVNLGLALIEAGHLHEAETHLETALQRQPDYAEAHINLGLIAFRRGDLAAAEEHCRAALRLKPYEADFHKNLAVVLRARGDTQGAAAEQQRATALRGH